MRESGALKKCAECILEQIYEGIWKKLPREMGAAQQAGRLNGLVLGSMERCIPKVRVE